ncbi:hypothetical protein CQ12_00235 [Bradyrhizobium jicamae]|uniref:Uncharacterized protein n=1 Tax=Bradyrhizobium jicamae TaxID=280332 RepID=A0A0R3LJD8_9BRAD|nr:hypothetical protein CQ12_00235 [Bradyrhizobium jicamae]
MVSRTLPISGRQSVLCASYDDIAVRFLRGRAGDAVQVVLLASQKLRVINATLPFDRYDG